MGETFFLPISRLVSAKEVKVPPLKIVYHFLVSSAASKPAEGCSLGKRTVLNSSPTVRVFGMEGKIYYHTTTAWGVWGGQKLILLAMCWHAASIAALSL